MKITVIGAGVVGQATGKGFARLGHDVAFEDTSGEVRLRLNSEGYKTQGHSLPDLVFICVPERVVEGVVGGYADSDIPLVIRSTVPPGTTNRLSQKYRLHLSSNPEFLREAVAEYEFLNPPGIIIGPCCDEHEELLSLLYEPFNVPIHCVEPTVAELTKLVINGYLACQISYWNQVKGLTDKIGVNSHEIGMLANHCDDRVSVYGARMHGKPYGGKCLPKDLQQLIVACESNGIATTLFKAIKYVNDSTRG